MQSNRSINLDFGQGGFPGMGGQGGFPGGFPGMGGQGGFPGGQGGEYDDEEEE